MLDIGNELVATQYDGVIDEGGASLDSKHLLLEGALPALYSCIKGHFSPWLRNILVL